MKKYDNINEYVADYYERKAEKYRLFNDDGLYMMLSFAIVLSTILLGIIISSIIVSNI